MKYGDEREILNKSLPIVEALYCWVNGCSFSLDDSREIEKECRGTLEPLHFRYCDLRDEPNHEI
jgi:hypothetical protein